MRLRGGGITFTSLSDASLREGKCMRVDAGVLRVFEKASVMGMGGIGTDVATAFSRLY